MKRLIVLSVLLLLICPHPVGGRMVMLAGGADPILQSSGSVSRTNMRMSIVAGTAFVDFSSAGALTAYLGSRLVITNVTGGKTLTGYIKAAGTGETYGDTLIANGGFDSDTTSWAALATGTLTSEAGGENGNCLKLACSTTSNGGCEQLISITSGILVNYIAWHKQGPVNGNGAFRLGAASIGSEIVLSAIVNNANWTSYSYYGTTNAITLNVRMRNDAIIAGQYALFDTVSVTQVLTPSTTGVTITNSANGATYNWKTETSGFDRNDAAGYTYAIYTY